MVARVHYPVPDLYYGGDTFSVEQPQSFTCPYCGKMGFTETSLQEHVTSEHAETSTEVVSVTHTAKDPSYQPWVSYVYVPQSLQKLSLEKTFNIPLLTGEIAARAPKREIQLYSEMWSVPNKKPKLCQLRMLQLPVSQVPGRLAYYSAINMWTL